MPSNNICRTFWDKAQRFPPILVRLLARHRYGPPLSDEEIAAGSTVDGSRLNPIQVNSISQCTDWSGVDVPTMRRFLQGCRLDLENRAHLNRAWTYITSMRRNNFKYLRTSDRWLTYYEPMVKRWRGTIVKG